VIHARPDYDRFQDPAGKIGKTEPVMLFRAQDRHFVDVLAYYLLRLAKDQDARADMIVAVVRHIRRAQVWQLTHPTKTPDLPPRPEGEGEVNACSCSVSMEGPISPSVENARHPTAREHHEYVLGTLRRMIASREDTRSSDYDARELTGLYAALRELENMTVHPIPAPAAIIADLEAALRNDPDAQLLDEELSSISPNIWPRLTSRAEYLQWAKQRRFARLHPSAS
jgi:hypothetical protein